MTAETGPVGSTTDGPGAARAAWPDDDTLRRTIVEWLPGQRWYPAKGTAPAAAAGTQVVGHIGLTDPDGEALVTDALVGIPSPGGGLLLQVPLVLAPAPPTGHLHDLPGAIRAMPGGSVLCDGTHHPAFLRALAARAEEQGTAPDLAGLDPDRARVLRGEQSNTSVLVPRRTGQDGPDGILKVFRVLSPGANPEVEVAVALAGEGWTGTPEPLGWVEGAWVDDGQERHGHLAVVTAFVPGAHDGFELACYLAREGTSFVDLAADLGRTIARMHQALAAAFPPADDRDGATRAAALAAALRDRVAWAAGEVPELAEYLPQVQAALDEVEALPDIPLDQRIHGDFHLGQCLHTESGWYVLDFEGEPMRPLEARTHPDQPLRDLVGALRSIDYAAVVGNGSPEWAAQARRALHDAYLGQARGPDEGEAQQAATETALERALLLERALYEAVYEARNRPDWLPIPLEAIRREVHP